MSDQPNRISACLLTFCALLVANAQGREMGVLVIPGERATMEQSWQGTGWKTGSVLRPVGLPGAEFVIAERTPDATNAEFFAQIESVRALVSSDSRPLSLAAGEVLQRSASVVSLYLGYLIAETSGDLELRDLLAWARRHGYSVTSAGRGRSQWIVTAQRSAAAVLSSVANGPRSISLQPVVIEIPLGFRSQPPPPPGGFHRIPRKRNILAATIVPNGLASEFVAAAQVRGGVEIADWPDDGAAKNSGVVLVQFAEGEQKMLDAQHEIRQLELASVQELGPAVSTGKIRVLGNRLIVRFNSPAGRDFMAPWLTFHGLEPIHEIPWLEDTVVYRSQGEASYRLYTVAGALLASGHVILALPDTYLWAKDAEGTTFTKVFSDCIYQTQPFLDAAQATGARNIWASHDSATRIAFIDRGFLAAGDFCKEIRVKAMLDTTDQDLTEFPRCDPCSSTAWCETEISAEACDPTCGELFGSSSVGTHGEGVSLVAAAIHSPTLAAGSVLDCEAPRGMIDGAETLLIRRADKPSEWILSSLLVWAAGAEPGHARFGDSLPPEIAASVLNLSFQMEYQDESDCVPDPVTDPASDTASDCAEICTAENDCSLLDSTLNYLVSNHDPAECPEPPQNCIRDGGVLIVNARAHVTNTSDLDSSPDTASIGTVAIGGDIVNADGYYYHELSDYTEIVAPMGGDGETELGTNWGVTGNSSAAAGAVSGVAAMMFDVNPSLTALQARCLLRATASTRSEEDDWWPESRLQGWSIPRQGTINDCGLAYPMCNREHDCTDGICNWEDNCTFQSGRSLCLGGGLVDAGRAVEAAEDCVLNLKGSMRAPDKLLQSMFCICDAAGNHKPVYQAFRNPTQVSFSDSGVSFPPFAWVLWECIRRGDCECLPGKPCPKISIVNPHNIDWAGLNVEWFIDKHSWPIPGDWPTWPAGGELDLSVPPAREVLQMWRETGIEPRIRVFSRGKEIELRASALKQRR